MMIFLLVAFAFWYLWSYRLNDPLPTGIKIKNFELQTLDGQKFSTAQINIPFAIIFLNKKGLFSNNIYANAYLNRMQELKLLQKSGKLYIIVLIDTEQNDQEFLKLLEKKEYKILENIVYLGNIEQTANYFGVRSWPHFFMMSPDKEIIYQSKLPSIEKINSILRGI